ncbi:MAG: 50S ribosomal protein L22 [Pedosphaera sp.]|nr:50S ribosomal protein L22 [Pedosphaera sp.]MSU42762.1 50S ribosomal protein L22 [Pedosphaera sp.]
MEVRSITRNAKMSAQKVREVARQIQGMTALHAKAVLASVPRKSARLIAKTLASAIANAENNNNLKVETLRVKEAWVGQATPARRMMTRARGSAATIIKGNCHIRIVLSDGRKET